MKKRLLEKRLLAGLVAGALLVVSSASFAQQHGPGGPGGRGEHGGPGRPGGHGPGGPGGPRPGMGPGMHRPPPPVAYRPDPGYRRWGRGEVVPYPYRGPQYVVNDWRGHHLSPPPRGYQWVNYGADYFLIGIATGVVLQSLFN